MADPTYGPRPLNTEGAEPLNYDSEIAPLTPGQIATLKRVQAKDRCERRGYHRTGQAPSTAVLTPRSCDDCGDPLDGGQDA